MRRTSKSRPGRLVSLLAVPWLVCAGCRKEQQQPPPPEVVMPTPRALSPAERAEVTRALAARSGEAPPADAQFGAAGAFRVVVAARMQYLERTDMGSVILERADYAATSVAFDSMLMPRAALLARVDDALGRSGLDAAGRRFVTFEDEFAGAAPRGPAGAAPPDPRRAARLVGRTAEYERVLDGVPVFGSELVIGLMPDGRVGRLRLHWPKIDPALVVDARRLQERVKGQTWEVPAGLRGGDTRILDIAAGVAHSGIADPGFRAAAVVRVTYRRVSPDSVLPLVTTGYKYFDANGREVVLTVYPSAAPGATPSKPPVRTP